MLQLYWLPGLCTWIISMTTGKGNLHRPCYETGSHHTKSQHKLFSAHRMHQSMAKLHFEKSLQISQWGNWASKFVIFGGITGLIWQVVTRPDAGIIWFQLLMSGDSVVWNYCMVIADVGMFLTIYHIWNQLCHIWNKTGARGKHPTVLNWPMWECLLSHGTHFWNLGREYFSKWKANDPDQVCEWCGIFHIQCSQAMMPMMLCCFHTYVCINKRSSYWNNQHPIPVCTVLHS